VKYPEPTSKLAGLPPIKGAELNAVGVRYGNNNHTAARVGPEGRTVMAGHALNTRGVVVVGVEGCHALEGSGDVEAVIVSNVAGR
jgi:hypothetical protein